MAKNIEKKVKESIDTDTKMVIQEIKDAISHLFRLKRELDDLKTASICKHEFEIILSHMLFHTIRCKKCGFEIDV